MKISFAEEFWIETKIAFKESPKLFFAPIIGAFKYTDAEWDRVIREAKERWAVYDAENAEADAAEQARNPA